MMRKSNIIRDFFKRKDAQSSNVNVDDKSSPTFDIPISENSSRSLWRVDDNEFDNTTFEFDPELCHQI
jgi:hypothetical protein